MFRVNDTIIYSPQKFHESFCQENKKVLNHFRSNEIGFSNVIYHYMEANAINIIRKKININVYYNLLNIAGVNKNSFLYFKSINQDIWFLVQKWQRQC